ncbi:MAG: hypothetical protein KF770_07790 [Anaerolineae bacterium]|nr:hypothetical protein [Anaerolineae bacterium]
MALPDIPQLACVRDDDGQVAGFMAVVAGKVEMLFIHHPLLHLQLPNR